MSSLGMEKIGQVSRTVTAASPRLGSARSTPRLRTPSSMPGPTSSSRPRGLPSRVTGTPTTPSLGSKVTSNGTPSVTSGSGVKRLQKEFDTGRAKLPVQRSRSTHELVVEGKEDTKERNNFGVILNSNVNNICTPTRKSGVNMKGYSCGSKPTTPSRSSSGRPSLSSKRSLGGNTPTPTVSRRSGGSKLRVSGHAQFLQDGCPSVTPEVCRKSWSNTCSPDVDACDGRAETTSVSVAVRVRPFNAREKDCGEDRSILEVLGNTVKITQDSNTAQSFTFDHCFWSCDENHPQYASQEHVYNTMAVPLLEKAYEGYNTCLFAYGQTGSGKSYTMLGEDCLREIGSTASVTAGVIPRFCADVIQKANSIHAHNPPEGQLPHTQVEIELSYLEIYNEQIYDLLGGMSSSGSREALRVREDPRTGPYVEGIACHTVSSMDHLMTWLMLGNRERSIAATGLNDKSSRSHAVFTLKLTQTQTEDVEGEELESSKVSILNLVDLAGSERVGASLSHGDRLKEGVFINKSLLTLGKVINSLAESEGRRRPFIPYRESVLTFLLKESLGGNSRTTMIATVSPSAVNIEETRSTLRYAQQTRRIINHNYVNEDPTAVIIRSLKKEVERLRLQQLAKVSPLLLMGEDEPLEEQNHNSEEGDKDKILMEKERHILEREKEMNQLIEAKEREISLLREQVRCHQVLNEKTKSLEQRLKETERQQQQALETLRQMGVAEKNEEGPVLINLNEDPQLSEKLSYKLKIGTTCIGSSDCDLLLPGLHTDSVHCSIFNDKGRLKLIPRADADTYINGKLAEGPVTLSHSDRLILAGIYFFKVSIPHQANKKMEKSFNVDFYFTKEELLKEQEKRLQKEAEEAVALSKAEMERELEWHKQQLLCDVQDAHTQLVEKERRVCELQGAHWKLQQEKRLLEEKLNRGQQHTDFSPESLDNPQSNFLYEVEAVLNESVMEVKKESSNIPPMLSFRIKEANQICRKLRKAYEFMIQEVLSESGLEVVVVVKDLHHQMTATLSPASFTDVLQLLRTSAKDEDTEVFENGLRWEKAEDVTCVPGFLNRLLECSAIQNCNLSINSSFNTSSSSIFSYSKTRKMNNFRHLSEMSIREIPQNECRVSVGVAAALHQVLETLPATHLHTPILSSVLSALCCLYEDVEHIKDHTTEPGHTLSDEELSKSLIQLFHHSQSVISSIAAAGNSEAVILAHGKDQFQDDIQKNIMKLSNCTSRLFQGVKTETESLVEESCATLIRLVHSLVEEVAKLSLLTALPMPDTSFFKPGDVIGGKFTGGLKIALECLVKQCGETASKAAIRLATDMSQTSDSFSTAAFSAIDNIAAFLKKYAALNTTLDYEPKLSIENQRLKLVQWIDCVESAAETLIHLKVAVMDIVNQTKLFQEGKMLENFPTCIKEVLKSLQNLMPLAGLGSSLMGKGACLASYSRNKQLMDELRSKGRHAIKGMEKLEILCDSQNNTLESSVQETPIKYKEKVLTQWPKTSKEFQLYLQHNSPLKSSFQSSFHRDEKGKKVRFNVSHVSSVSFNSQNNGL